MKHPVCAGLLSCSLLASPAYSDEPPPPQQKPVTGSFHELLSSAGIDISGHIDLSYTQLSGSGRFTSGVPNRVFDVERNSFNLQAIDFTVARLPKQGFGGLVNLTAGKDANVIAAYDTSPNDGTTTGKKDDFDITQAFVQYATGPLSVMFGKYVTLAGAEVIKSPVNSNFSRSILFGYAIPFTHTGIRATYAVNDKLSLIAGANNGWDVLKDTNSQKTAELGLTFAPNDILSFALSGYSGTEQVAGPLDTAKGRRNIIDAVATLALSDKFKLVLNYDVGTQRNATLASGATGKAKWDGLAAYANYHFNDQWRLSLRGETFNDKDGYRTGVAQRWKEATLTVAYMPTKEIELRAEVRADRSNVASFLQTDGTAKRNQQSFGLEALYKF